MRRLLALLVVAVLLSAIAGCGGGGSSPTPPPPVPGPAPAPTPEPTPPQPEPEPAWTKPPRFRGLWLWNPDDDPRLRRISNAVQIKLRDWWQDRDRSRAEIRRRAGEGWTEAVLLAPTLHISPGDRWAIRDVAEFVQYVRDQGLTVRLVIIGDEPPLFDRRAIEARNWVYDELRRRLNDMGLAETDLCYDWYPWGVQPGGGGDWEAHIDRNGWPREDCLCNHAGYGAHPPEAMRRINRFSLRWLRDHGWPDVPVMLTLQGFNFAGWPYLEGRLRAMWRLDYPGDDQGAPPLAQPIYERLGLVSIYAWQPTPDCHNTVRDFPEVQAGLADLMDNQLKMQEER